MGDAVGSVVPGNWLVDDIEGNNDVVDTEGVVEKVVVDAEGVGDSVPTAGEAVGTPPLPKEVGSIVLSGDKVGIGSIGNVGSNVGSIGGGVGAGVLGIIGTFVLGIVGAGVLGTCGAMVGGSVAGSTVNIGGASVGDCTGEDGSIF